MVPLICHHKSRQEEYFSFARSNHNPFSGGRDGYTGVLASVGLGKGRSFAAPCSLSEQHQEKDHSGDVISD